MPTRESLGRKVAFDGSVAAVEDTGDSDFADALREQRGLPAVFTVQAQDYFVKTSSITSSCARMYS